MAPLGLLAAALTFATQASAASILESGPAVPGRGEARSAVSHAARPAYRVLEGVSDGVYDFLRSYFIGGILPGRLSRSLRQAPRQDSYGVFVSEFQKKEARLLERVRESYPMPEENGSYDPRRLKDWRGDAAQEQVEVAVDAFRETLFTRYGLKGFGGQAERYAKDHRNWDPGFVAMAGLMGGTFAYFNGIHANASVGALRLSMDVRPFLRVRSALKNGGTSDRLAALELGYKSKPVTLAAEWGAAKGRPRPTSLGLKYRLKY